MRRILLTGGSGFVGAELSALLRARGYDVVATASKGSGTLIGCDINDSSAVRNLVAEVSPDVIFHCAAISNVIHADSLAYYATNVIATKNLLEAVKALGSNTRFLFLSTAGVYGNQTVDKLHEDLAPRPVHDYGMSKLCAELWIMQAAAFCNPTIFRLFNVIGPGQKSTFILPKLAIAFARGARRISLGNLDVYRDYIDLRSCCQILADFIEVPASIGEIINVCSGRATSLRELISEFQAASGYEIEVVQDDALIRSNEVWRLIGSTEKCERLSIYPRSIRSLSCVVNEMVHYYKENG